MSRNVHMAADHGSAGTLELPRAVDEFVGERWPFMQGRLRSTATQGAIPLTALQCSREAMQWLDRFAEQYPDQDLRGIASLWAQWYLVSVWPPLMAAVLALERSPELDSAHTALLVDAGARPEGLALRSFPVREESTSTALERLVREHAAPMLEAVAVGCGVAPRVLWSNAANVFGWYIDELEPIAGAPAVEPGRHLLMRPRWSDGTRNPLYMPNAQVAPPRAARRVCCLRYRLEGFGYCPDCPITCRNA